MLQNLQNNKKNFFKKKIVFNFSQISKLNIFNSLVFANLVWQTRFLDLPNWIFFLEFYQKKSIQNSNCKSYTFKNE